MNSARILVIGAGVNGSVCAAALQDAGIDVTIMARGQRFDELRVQGIVIEDPFKQSRSVTRMLVIDRLEPIDIYDYVLVVVRKNQVADLLPTLAANQSPNIVFMGNNLAGPGEMIAALGRERVMMGSVYAAGKRDGNVIRAMTIRSVASPFGEIDGAITPRLKRLAGILRRAGLRVKLSTDIIDTQANHAAGVALIGALTMRHGGDVRALARATDDLRLFAAARREAHRALRARGQRVVPWSEAAMDAVPAFLQVAGMRALLNSKYGEVGLAWHVSQAPDEMRCLMAELQALVDQAGLPAPAIRKVLAQAPG